MTKLILKNPRACPKKEPRREAKRSKPRRKKIKPPSPQHRSKERTKKRNKNRKEEKGERTRTGKEGNSQISNLSKIESNFDNSSYVESVIVKSGILKINNRGTKTMEPFNKIKQISISVNASSKNGKKRKVW